MDVLERSKVSYWETRTINIGDYEKVECGLSISHSVIEPSGGYGNKQISIKEAASIDAEDVQDINKVANHLIKVVKAKLDAVEKNIRMQMRTWEGISFDTEKKLVQRDIIKMSEYSGSHKKKFEISDEDLE